MSSHIKISVIVPVYNAEKYLTRCLQSLVTQTMKQIQIICVNDGSNDDSICIINKFKNKFKNKITIIDKPNEGVWKARIDGIKSAKGEYITFCDSDDYVDKYFLEKMYKKAKQENADICVCGFKRVDENTNKAYSTEMTKIRKNILVEQKPEELISINTALWNKLYKADILKKANTIKNPPRILEDMMFLTLIYPEVRKITFLNEALYYYMVKKGTAITTTSKKDIEKTQNAMLEVKEVYKKYNDKMNCVLDCFSFLHFGISLMFRLSSNKENKLSVLLKENKKYLDENFQGYRNVKYLKIAYVIKNKSSNLKVAIMKKIYLSIFFRLFLSLYNFMINKLKIDIKW